MYRVTCHVYNTRPGPGGRHYTCEAGGCDHVLEEEEVAAMEAQLEQEMETTDCSDPDVIQVMVVIMMMMMMMILMMVQRQQQQHHP